MRMRSNPSQKNKSNYETVYANMSRLRCSMVGHLGHSLQTGSLGGPKSDVTPLKFKTVKVRVRVRVRVNATFRFLLVSLRVSCVLIVSP